MNSDKSVKPLRVRIVIAGTEAGGKSCIIKRYCEKRFVAKYLPTVGIDYGATRIFVDKREVRIITVSHFWSRRLACAICVMLNVARNTVLHVMQCCT